MGVNFGPTSREGAITMSSAAFVYPHLFPDPPPPKNTHTHTHSASDAAERCARLDSIVNLLLRLMDETNYNKRIASLSIDTVLDAPFLTDPALCEDGEGPIRRFFARVVRVSTIKKSFLLVDLTARFVAVWRRVGQQAAAAAAATAAPTATPPLSSALCFVEEIVQLLTMREQDISLHHRPDDGEAPADGGEGGKGEEAGAPAGPPVVRCVRSPLNAHILSYIFTAHTATRYSPPPLRPTTHSITVLSFLSELLRDERQRPLLDRLLVALFDTAAAANVRKAQLAGSSAFSTKLRCV
jgi:hypothetical protein